MVGGMGECGGENRSPSRGAGGVSHRRENFHRTEELLPSAQGWGNKESDIFQPHRPDQTVLGSAFGCR